MRRGTSWLCAVLAIAAGCGGLNPDHTGTSTAGSTAGTETDGETDGEGSWSEETEYELRLNEDAPEPIVLEMTKSEVAELFGPVADQVLLLELDTTALFTNSLDEIKAACGTDWQLDEADPNHDCSTTPLGQTFEGPDGTWRTSAEYSLVRILTMTPANVVVEGTSSAGLQELSDIIGIGGGYSQILSDALGIPRTEVIVSTANLVESFQENFMGSHPNVDDAQLMPITLHDALNNLEPLSQTFGPSGDHPGILDPDFPIHGEVFGPDFQMRAVADSNLRLVDGIDLDQGKDFMNLVVDASGPTYQDELEFDFNDPDKFQLSGLVEDLQVDMRFGIQEYVDFVPACVGDPPCVDNLPGAPAMPDSVWWINPWKLEYNVTAAAMKQYDDRVFYGSYSLGAAKLFIGMGGNPAGWLHYDILLDLGNPPGDQYLWETVLEVAEVALHNTPYNTFPEGSANVEFTQFDVPVGMTGDEAAEAVRPFLQDQSAELSDFILGDYKKNNGYLDFYYRRSENGNPYLVFVAPEDLREGEQYTYDQPGFYSDPDLSEDSKVSRSVIAGLVDTSHEKLRLDAGETTLYVRDDGGQVYRVRADVPVDEDRVIKVRIARRL